MVVVVCCGLFLSVAGCTETVNVTTTEAPTTNPPIELLSGFTVYGFTIEPGADLSNADLTGADLTGADLTGADLTGAILKGATMPDGWQ